MTHDTVVVRGQLGQVADRLRLRRPLIMRAWRKAADADPRLTTASTLPRSQFNDHIPAVLDAFEDRLRAWPQKSEDAKREQREKAAAHGLQRWQQGYHLREVTHEWGHLHLVLVDELESVDRETSDSAGREALALARRLLAELCSHGVSESTSQYFQLQQVEAQGHVRDLARTLEEVHELERQRAELWRQAAHDLRGQIGAVAQVSSGIASESTPPPVRDRFVGLLQRSVASLVAMLDDVMDLARLQAGHEYPEYRTFDASGLLSGLVEELRPLALQRGLRFRAEGPEHFEVVGDPVKVRRIAQNLILNALRYTHAGTVSVSWGDSRENDSLRWMFCIQDTGPGLHGSGGGPLAGALEVATDEARQVDLEAGIDVAAPADPQSTPARNTPRRTRAADHPDDRREGIGLSIVKRLADLIDASIEVESGEQTGTLFRVVLPREPQPPTDSPG